METENSCSYNIRCNFIIKKALLNWDLAFLLLYPICSYIRCSYNQLLLYLFCRSTDRRFQASLCVSAGPAVIQGRRLRSVHEGDEGTELKHLDSILREAEGRVKMMLNVKVNHQSFVYSFIDNFGLMENQDPNVKIPLMSFSHPWI